MRSLLAVMIVATAGVAGAHPLGSEQSLLDQLGHQLLGAHHLPLLLALIVAGLFAARGLRRRRQ